jgi:ribonuclease D
VREVVGCQARGCKLYPYFHALDAMTEHHPTPDKDQIALLAPFERLGLHQIALVATARQAARALEELDGITALGFDTESKPTFMKNEASTGPHIVQLSTLEKAYIFQLEDAECRRAVALLLQAGQVIKAGFGLGDDRRRIIHKLGVDPQGVLDLNTVFRERGYRKDMGVRGAVAVLFNQRFIKSRKATTSNWANVHLQESQLIYAANDAYAALRVYQALGLG